MEKLGSPSYFIKSKIDFETGELSFNLFEYNNNDPKPLKTNSNVFEKFLTDKNLSYLSLVDFDDHFEDVGKDWRN